MNLRLRFTTLPRQEMPLRLRLLALKTVQLQQTHQQRLLARMSTIVTCICGHRLTWHAPSGVRLGQPCEMNIWTWENPKGCTCPGFLDWDWIVLGFSFKTHRTLANKRTVWPTDRVGAVQSQYETTTKV